MWDLTKSPVHRSRSARITPAPALGRAPHDPRRLGSQSSAQVSVARYEAEVLSNLDPKQVVRDLMDVCGGQPGVLLCWEREPPDPSPCHRGLVSWWLHRELGLLVPELGHEELGAGDRHPKLSACVRAR